MWLSSNVCFGALCLRVLQRIRLTPTLKQLLVFITVWSAFGHMTRAVGSENSLSQVYVDASTSAISEVRPTEGWYLSYRNLASQIFTFFFSVSSNKSSSCNSSSNNSSNSNSSSSCNSNSSNSNSSSKSTECARLLVFELGESSVRVPRISACNAIVCRRTNACCCCCAATCGETSWDKGRLSVSADFA
ncbi:hypothetical protein Emed_004214 [Eimeria media]